VSRLAGKPSWKAEISLGRGGGGILIDVIEACPGLREIDIRPRLPESAGPRLVKALESRQGLRVLSLSSDTFDTEWPRFCLSLELISRILLSNSNLTTVDVPFLYRKLWAALPALSSELEVVKLWHPTLTESELSWLLSKVRILLDAFVRYRVVLTL
jgi:hypothetical protein